MSIQDDVTGGQGISMRVLEAVADRNGVDPLELRPPLYEVIDPEALETLFASTPDTERSGRLEFTYAGCRITLTGGAEPSITVDSASQDENRSRDVAEKQLLD